MAILNIQTVQPPGLTSVNPSFIYILTNDTYATVTATGYLTNAKQEGFTFSNSQMALVYTTDDGPSLFKVVITYSGANILNTVVSLVQISTPGDVILPTITNHIAVFTNTTGTIGEDALNAINAGNIIAGVAGDPGSFISIPPTAVNGSLILKAIDAGGAFNTTISNSAMLQTSVISIPDPSSATANFIVSKLTGTQHITVGALQVDAGVISSGLATGGTAGGLIAYPATTTTGSLQLTPVSNVGNFAATISNVTALGQASIYTMPDPANAAARFLVGATATPFTSGNFPVASGTGGLMVDSGVAATALQQSANIKAASTADIGGAGAGPISVVVAGLTAASKIVATIASSSNVVAVGKCIATATGFDITFTGDPGAACVVNYVAFVVAQ